MCKDPTTSSSVRSRMGAMAATMPRTVFGPAVLAMVASLFACNGYRGGPAVGDRAFVAMLKEKAAALAQAEMAKYNALDELYKDKVEFSSLSIPVIGSSSGAYLKQYRRFEGFEIKDIYYRPESLLYPIVFEISFDYETFATDVVHATTPDAAEAAKAMTQFNSYGRYALTRRFRCDMNGNYVGSLPPRPPIPNFFSRQSPVEEKEGSRPDTVGK